MSLSTAGVLTDGGAAAGNSTVTFGYNEPGALPTFTLHSGNVSGTLPWMGTVYPAEGAVPSGMSLSSPDDTSMRATVLSTWPDGSARVMVVAGHKTGILANSTTTVRVRPAIVSDTPMTTSNLIAIVSTVAVNFGTPLSLTLTVNNHDRVWWANSQVICARYRLPITNKGVMEAVIDVHAFANGRAFVEVVIENSKLDPASPVKPTAQTYTNATVSVNESVIATESSPITGTPIGTYSGQSVNWSSSTHEAFRAWYCSTWVNGGDPGISVAHDTASMQALPSFFKFDKTSSVNLDAVYASDAQQRWHTGRYQPSMGGGGDAPHIGIYPEWECQYLQSGNKTVRNATIANALNSLTFDFNYRDQSGNVPNFTDIGNKDVQNGNWPVNYAKPSTNKSGAGHSHCPSIGMVAFMCRPSPCFIEIAQKICVFNVIWNNWGYGPYGASAEIRAKAWGIRDHAQAIFLSPDGHPWKAPGQARLALAFNHGYAAGNLNQYTTDSRGLLNFTWAVAPNSVATRPDTVGFGLSLFENYYLLQSLHMASSLKVLTGADLTNLNALANWVSLLPVRYVNEAIGGSFRLHFYGQDGGRDKNGGTIDSLSTWGAQLAWKTTDTPLAVSGPMMTNSGIQPTSWADPANQVDNSASAFYPTYFWAALCCAVERGVAGADTAWDTFTANVTNLSTWRNGFATSARWAYYPRNK
jgi:hypothetical protein